MFIMLWLFATIIVGIFSIKLFENLINAAAKKHYARATVFALPFFVVAFPFICTFISSSWSIEDNSKEIFSSVFNTQPTSQIQNLKGQDLSREEEQEEPTFLSFQASPATMAKLTNKRLTLLSQNERKFCDVQNWQSPPSWFSTEIKPQTQIYHQANTGFGGNHWLFYEPNGRTARVFFGTTASETAPY